MVHFVGAGPGAVDLITVRGQQLLSQADVILYAGSLINKELLSLAKADAKLYDSATMTLEEMVDVMTKADAKGQDIVRLQTGDLSLYSALKEQTDALDALGIAYDCCPGVSAFGGAAAALDLEYTLPDVSQSVVITRMAGRTDVPEKERVASFARHGSTMVFFLSAGLMAELQEELLAGGLPTETPVAIVYKATWPEEEICHCTVDDMVQTAQAQGINRTALIIVGDVLDPKTAARSKLYDPAFTTGYRKGQSDEDSPD